MNENLLKTCPCDSGKNYEQCCGRFISRQQLPATPQELMRSRYTAYVLGHMDYIEETMKSPAIDDFNSESAAQWASKNRWDKLEVINSNYHENIGFVEFRAHFSHQNHQHVLHEISEFHFKEGRWYYVDGQCLEKSEQPKLIVKKPGRNEICPCGSNKKFKKCCGSQ